MKVFRYEDVEAAVEEIADAALRWRARTEKREADQVVNGTMFKHAVAEIVLRHCEPKMKVDVKANGR